MPPETPDMGILSAAQHMPGGAQRDPGVAAAVGHERRPRHHGQAVHHGYRVPVSRDAGPGDLRTAPPRHRPARRMRRPRRGHRLPDRGYPGAHGGCLTRKWHGAGPAPGGERAAAGRRGPSECRTRRYRLTGSTLMAEDQISSARQCAGRQSAEQIIIQLTLRSKPGSRRSSRDQIALLDSAANTGTPASSRTATLTSTGTSPRSCTHSARPNR